MSIETQKTFVKFDKIDKSYDGEALVVKNLNLVKKPSDIFNLDYAKVQILEGWGELSINNLKKAITNSQLITLDKFIFSIGIRHIGQENAKILAG